MRITATLLLANPRDEEEDDMALLCCHGSADEMFLMTRFPDEEELEITLGDDPYLLRDLKVTLSADRLLVAVAAGDAAVFGGDDLLEIVHASDAAELAQIEETLRILLEGVGTLEIG
ncbi:hypothetical protein AHFPHNDE_01370 [Pseudomonas sp. MM227]|uniref:hypothetical protein n=1 Tax=unclassified Pseudomonas TaxID=196821 RepID=UPI00177DF467|nr:MULTISPECIES: hypothetical protein [unclassified Pseudomonas]MBD8593157.1 hypothetical protein [Pseudomonas sp. CFBP 8758]MBD8601046.1 hypothetical protein [Pseudomonas sp. CFBP 8771]MBD8731125.1 hypothetical protein [Pseudomonas sp. CFBP 13710]CAI3787701.1 hypothetical protein AHFPHNDE_01370 [Pseudomonas sp. MM227]